MSFDPLDARRTGYAISLGSGRTSSSPAPVLKYGYAMGCSGGLSFAGFWGASSDTQGTVGWFIVPGLDFKAVKLDPGVPEGEKAKSGQTYTATVEFGSFFDTWFSGLSEVGIDADVNGQPTVITDVYGQELPKVSYNGKTFYVLSPVPSGDGTWTVKFNWTAPAADKAVLRAWINLEMGRINATWPETDGATPEDPKNNLKEVEVPVEGVDLAVNVAFPTKNYVISWNNSAGFPTAMVKVFRTDNGTEPVKFRLTMTGPEGPKVMEMTITDKPQVFFYSFPATKAGKYTVEARVEAVGVQETDLSNNAGSDWTEVAKQPPPSPGKESGKHGELRS